MRSRLTRRFFALAPGSRPSTPGPWTPNDNPEIEAFFSTLTGSVHYPGRFASLEEARAWCAGVLPVV